MLREATVEDADVIAELEAELFPDNCLNEKSVRDELRVSKAWVWDEYGVVGYAITRLSDPVDLLRLGVAKARQRSCIGRTLLWRVLLEATDLGRDVILTVREDNGPARRLYESKRFYPYGWMPQEASIVMRWHP